MKESIYNVYDKVVRIMEEEPETRDSDALLTVRYFERQLGRKLPEMRECLLSSHTPTTESIRRARQKAQQERLHLHSTGETRKRRGQLEDEYREFAKEETT